MASANPAADRDDVIVFAYSDIVKVRFEETEAVVDFEVGGDTRIEWNDDRIVPLLRTLFDRGIAMAAWIAAIEDDVMAEAATRVMSYLMRSRLVYWRFGTMERPLLEIMPVRGTVNPYCPVEDASAFTLSDLAVLTYRDGLPTISHPSADATLTFLPDGLGLLAGVFGHGRAGAEHASPLPQDVVTLLAGCGFLTDPAAPPAARAAWSPEEWLYHRRTRAVGHRELLTMADRAVVPPVPPPHRVPPGQGVRLPAVPPSPLSEIMDARRSRRAPGPDPVTLEDVSAVLWRVARHRADRFAMNEDLHPRNQPGGGAIGELEYYVAVNRCAGLDRGFYFYDGFEHVLVPVDTAPAAKLDQCFNDATAAMQEEAWPDCVIVLTTQQARLSKKYRGMAYRLTLMHVGVAYEAFYLAATELGLSPCAIGAGNLAVFQGLTGLSPYDETSIGEFALSGRPAAD